MMWQNDWEQVVYMFQLLFDNQRNGIVLLFFISFMQLANLIFINLIIAFVIDTYVSIEETLYDEKETKYIQENPEAVKNSIL